MGFLGIGEGTKVKNKTSRWEKLASALALEKATDPAVTDQAKLTQSMTAENLGRFYEPAPMDPRIADILGFLTPGAISNQQSIQGLMKGFGEAPTASPLGLRPYGNAPKPWMAPTDQKTPQAPEGGWSSFWKGTQPSADFLSSTRAVGNTLSKSVLDQLLADETPGELQQDAVRKHLKKPYSQDIFGPPLTSSQEYFAGLYG